MLINFTMDFYERKKIMKQRTQDSEYLNQISENLQFNLDNIQALRNIIEGLFLQTLTDKQSIIFAEEINKSGAIQIFIDQFIKFQHLGFSPYVV